MNAKSIFLIEDNISDIDLTRRAFARGRISKPLLIAEDGQEALDLIFCQGEHANRDVAELPALILLDLKLPKVDGLEVLRQIRADQRTRRIPVVILTSSREEEDVVMAYDLGANSFIRKPVDFLQFADAVVHLGLYWLVLNEPPPKVTR